MNASTLKEDKVKMLQNPDLFLTMVVVGKNLRKDKPKDVLHHWQSLHVRNLSSNSLNHKPFLINRRLNYTPPNFILLLLRYSELLFLLVLLRTIGTS